MMNQELCRMLVAGFVLPLMLLGCQNKAQTASLGGAGLGAIVGQVAGRSTEATLIGAAVGAGVGYVIGNEADKKEAARLQAQPNYAPPVTPLSGSSWLAVSVRPQPDPPFKSLTVRFGNDGYVVTNKILNDGTHLKVTERYRIVGNTLIVNKPGYMINAKYAIENDSLIIDCDKFSAVLQRI